MDTTKQNSEDWKQASLRVFWGEIAPCDHLLQVYENDTVFLNTLVGFTGDGFIRNESVIIIATAAHLKELEQRLISHQFDVARLIETHQYFPMDADEALRKFMVNNWPDEQLFNVFVNDILARARKHSGKVRAFGEMVAVLWEKGHSGATVRLEDLWHKLHGTDSFCLYCAYPKIGFTQKAQSSIENICKSHSRMIDGNIRPTTEIYYKDQAVFKPQI